MKSDKTLLEILVDELPKRGGWPDGYDKCSQSKISCYIDFFKSGEDAMKTPASHSVLFSIRHDEGDCYPAVTRDQYETALVEKNEGWIEWEGGECPVDPESMVVVKLRNGQIWLAGDAVMARNLDWSNEDSSLDVVGYRLSKPEETDQETPGYWDDVAGPITTIESLTDAIIAYGCEANLAYPLAKHLLASGLIK